MEKQALQIIELRSGETEETGGIVKDRACGSLVAGQGVSSNEDEGCASVYSQLDINPATYWDEGMRTHRRCQQSM
jgi:hypothetical protein